MTLPQPATLLGGISPERFLREYWQKKPLLVRQAFPELENPLSPDELAGLALEEEVESRIVLTEGATPWAPWPLWRGRLQDPARAGLDAAGPGGGSVCTGSGRADEGVQLPAFLAAG